MQKRNIVRRQDQIATKSFREHLMELSGLTSERVAELLRAAMDTAEAKLTATKIIYVNGQPCKVPDNATNLRAAELLFKFVHPYLHEEAPLDQFKREVKVIVNTQNRDGMPLRDVTPIRKPDPPQAEAGHSPPPGTPSEAKPPRPEVGGTQPSHE